MKNIKNQINDVDSKNDYSLSKSLCLLLIIFTASIVIRLYYLPFDLPLLLDAQHYFWYANDMSILKEIPTYYSSHNNFWASFLSIFLQSKSCDYDTIRSPIKENYFVLAFRNIFAIDKLGLTFVLLSLWHYIYIESLRCSLLMKA